MLLSAMAFDLRETAAGILLALGCIMALTGSVGLWRMPDFYSRLHPSGKSDTLAQALIIGALIVLSDNPLVMAKLALLSALLFVTAPTATHAVTKAAHLDGLKPHMTPENGTPDADSKTATTTGTPS